MSKHIHEPSTPLLDSELWHRPLARRRRRHCDIKEKANPERGWHFAFLVGPPRVELGTNGFRFV